MTDEKALVYEKILGSGEDDDVAIDEGEIAMSDELVVGHDDEQQSWEFDLDPPQIAFATSQTFYFHFPLPWLMSTLLLVSSQVPLLPSLHQNYKRKSARPAPRAKHQVLPRKARLPFLMLPLLLSSTGLPTRQMSRKTTLPLSSLQLLKRPHMMNSAPNTAPSLNSCRSVCAL